MQFLATSVVNYAQGIMLSSVFGILTLLTIFFAIFYLVKFGGNDKAETNILIGKKVFTIKKLLFIVILVGILARIICGLLVIGHRREFVETIYYSLQSISKYDSSDTNKILYPLTYYVMQLFAGIWISSGVSTDAVLLNFSIKIPFILADVAVAFILFSIAKKYFNQKVGLITSAFVMLCPMFIFTSSIWGSIVTLVCPLILLGFNLILNKNHVGAIAIFSISTLIAKEAVILLPVITVYFLYVWIKSISARFSGKNTSEDRRNSWLIPLTTVFCVVFGYLICLAYTSQFNVFSFFEVINEFYIKPFTKVFYFGENVANIYVLFGKNETVPSMKIPSNFNAVLMLVMFILLLICLTLAIFFRKKNRSLTILIGAYVFLTVNVYYVGLTAMTILPSLVLLLFAYLVIKDKRILKTFAVSCISLLIVACSVFTIAGYFNVEPLLFFKDESYTGQTYLTGDFSIPLIIASVFQVLNHLYMTYYIFEISYAKRIQLLNYKENCTVSDVFYMMLTKDKE